MNNELFCISDENSSEENQIQLNLNSCISNNNSFIFSTGAGAGKTFALIESLKYIVSKYSKNLKIHNQKVMCITYTNVAADEVKNRLGRSEFADISTIHERIWEIIKRYQKELLVVHKFNLNKKKEELYNELNNSTCKQYKMFTKEQQKIFSEVMIDNKEKYYNIYDLKSQGFKDGINEIFINIFDECTSKELLKNVANFKKTVNNLYKFDNIEKCLMKIEAKEKDFKRINYDARFNRDSLHTMRISHDTLLEYANILISNSNLLKRIIIDKYPYIFIDEYQDTSKEIIEIFLSILQYAKINSKKFTLGFFGDPIQSIYTNGVGDNIENILQKYKIDNEEIEVKKIDKPYNRRSRDEIIKSINTIRKDNIVQKSIYSNFAGGSVNFYNIDQSEIKNDLKDYHSKAITDFINKFKQDFNISVDNKLHCLFTTNKTVALRSGFEKIYDYFSVTSKYSGSRYQQLNTELMSDDINKLGRIPRLLFNILEFYQNAHNISIPINKIIGNSKNEVGNIKKLDLADLRFKLSKIQGDNFSSIIVSILNQYKNNNYLFDNCIKKLFKEIFEWHSQINNGTDPLDIKVFEDYLFYYLYDITEDNDLTENMKNNINSLLSLKLEEFINWYKYISRDNSGDIIYHTLHSTKGLEFENVLMVVEKNFGRKKTFFEEYLKNPHAETNKEAKKLFYVGCSRAITNLNIIYVNEIDSAMEENIRNIFGEIKM